MSDEYDWMEEATAIAAQCWCEPETSATEMDVILANVFAKKVAFWMQEAARNGRNTEYYRGLLEECGKTIGDRAYFCDDGTKSQDVLCEKIPEIIAADYVNGGG